MALQKKMCNNTLRTGSHQCVYQARKLLLIKYILTVFENHRKSLIQQCELGLHFEWIKNFPKWSIPRVFEKLKFRVKQFYQTGQI